MCKIVIWLDHLISKLRVTRLCAGNSPVTGEFPAQMASNPVNVSIWWRHHDAAADDDGYGCCVYSYAMMGCYGDYDGVVIMMMWWNYDVMRWWFDAMMMVMGIANLVMRWYILWCDDVIKWNHFPRYWPFVRGIHRSRWIPCTKASDAELWCFLWSVPE